MKKIIIIIFIIMLCFNMVFIPIMSNALVFGDNFNITYNLVGNIPTFELSNAVSSFSNSYYSLQYDVSNIKVKDFFTVQESFRRTQSFTDFRDNNDYHLNKLYFNLFDLNTPITYCYAIYLCISNVVDTELFFAWFCSEFTYNGITKFNSLYQIDDLTVNQVNELLNENFNISVNFFRRAGLYINVKSNLFEFYSSSPVLTEPYPSFSVSNCGTVCLSEHAVDVSSLSSYVGLSVSTYPNSHNFVNSNPTIKDYNNAFDDGYINGRNVGLNEGKTLKAEDLAPKFGTFGTFWNAFILTIGSFIGLLNLEIFGIKLYFLLFAPIFIPIVLYIIKLLRG